MEKEVNHKETKAGGAFHASKSMERRPHPHEADRLHPNGRLNQSELKLEHTIDGKSQIS